MSLGIALPPIPTGSPVRALVGVDNIGVHQHGVGEVALTMVHVHDQVAPVEAPRDRHASALGIKRHRRSQERHHRPVAHELRGRRQRFGAARADASQPLSATDPYALKRPDVYPDPVGAAIQSPSVWALG